MNQLSSNTPLTDKLIAENSIFCDSDNLCKLRDHACILELRILAKDKLIEQMRDAITEALAEEQCPVKEYWQTVETSTTVGSAGTRKREPRYRRQKGAKDDNNT